MVFRITSDWQYPLNEYEIIREINIAITTAWAESQYVPPKDFVCELSWKNYRILAISTVKPRYTGVVATLDWLSQNNFASLILGLNLKFVIYEECV